LLLRIQTNTKAISHIIDGGFWIEAPVLVRVSFEHACRLYLYNKDPENVFSKHPNALKLMGESPSAIDALKDFGDEMRGVYEMLCAFSHPDMMSMVLNQEDSPQNQFTCGLIITISLLMNMVILFRVYPDVKGIDFTSQISEQVNAIMQTMGTAFLDILSLQGHLFEELDNKMKLYPFMQQPFRRDELNDELNKFIEQFNKGELEKSILEKIQSLTVQT
jgi:hypothetical protein